MTRKRLRPTTANHCRLRLEALEPRDVPATLLTPGQPAGTPANGDSILLDVSKDGNYVLFASTAGNLGDFQQAAGVTNLYWADVTDPAKPVVQLITRRANTNQAVGWDGQLSGNNNAVLSADGRHVAYVTGVNAPVLTGNPAQADDNGTPDVFWWSPDQPTQSRLVSATTAGNAAGSLVPDGAYAAQISADGDYVAFVTTAEWAMKDVAGTTDIMRRQMSTGNLDLVTEAADGFHDAIGVYSSVFVSVGLGRRYMDDSGTHFAFFTTANAELITGTPTVDRNDSSDVFTRDMNLPGGGPGSIQLVSESRSAQEKVAIGAGNTLQAYASSISRDGNAVLFYSNALGTNDVNGNLAANRLLDNFTDNNGPDDDLYIDTTAFTNQATIKLVSGVNGSANQGADTEPTAHPEAQPQDFLGMSDDGSVVVFNSEATNLVDASRDRNGDWFDALVRDVNSNTTEFASVGPDGKTGDQASYATSVSGDGRYVVFTSKTSAQTFAGVPDTNNDLDVFVRDRQQQTTRLASITPDGVAAGNGPSTFGLVNDAGTRIVFSSRASDLSTPELPANNTINLFSARLPLGGTGLPNAVGISGSANGQAQTFTFDASGNLTPADSPVTPFAGFTGDVRTAVADIDGDGTPDTVYGIGPGGGSKITVIIGATGKTLASLDSVYESTFTGGVFLAAGDLDNDGRAEIVVSPDVGGGGRVVVFKLNAANTGLDRVADFFGIDDPSFRGGARVAVGDVNGDGVMDLIVAAGFGGGPRIAIFDGNSVMSNGSSPTKLRGDFFVFEQTLRNGVYIGSGDFDADGKDDLVFGGGPGGGPRITILSGANVLVSGDPYSTTPIANFFAGDTNQRGGVRVAAKDIDADGFADLVTGSGEGFPAHVRTYLGKNIKAAANGSEPTLLQDFPAFGGGTSAAGVFVG